jgi:hypothetical protein
MIEETFRYFSGTRSKSGHHDAVAACLIRSPRQWGYIEWPGRELNPRHADFQSELAYGVSDIIAHTRRPFKRLDSRGARLRDRLSPMVAGGHRTVMVHLEMQLSSQNCRPR